MMNTLKVKIDNLTNAKIRQIPTAKDLSSFAKNLEKKSQLSKSLITEIEKEINLYLKDNSLERNEIDNLISSAVHKFMSA